eukprot:scaffold73_cov337-Pavlova_lutheri.AAC.3
MPPRASIRRTTEKPRSIRLHHVRFVHKSDTRRDAKRRAIESSVLSFLRAFVFPSEPVAGLPVPARSSSVHRLASPTSHEAAPPPSGCVSWRSGAALRLLRPRPGRFPGAIRNIPCMRLPWRRSDGSWDLERHVAPPFPLGNMEPWMSGG